MSERDEAGSEDPRGESMKRNYGYIVFLMPLVGCSGNNVNATCTQGLSGGAKKSTPAIIEYSNRHCTAFVDLRSVSKGESAELLVWTAAHCTPLSGKHANDSSAKPKLSLLDSAGKYFEAFEIEDPFLQRAVAVRKAAAAISAGGANSPKSDALASLISSKVSVYSFPESSACRVAETYEEEEGEEEDGEENQESSIRDAASAAKAARLSAQKGSTEICFSPFETVAMRVVVTKTKINEQLAKNPSEADQLWQAMVGLGGSGSIRFAAAERKMQQNMLDMGVAFRFRPFIPLVDIVRWCRSGAPSNTSFGLPNNLTDLQTAKGFCAHTATLDNLIKTEIYDYSLTIDGASKKSTLAEFAKEKGADYLEPFKIDSSTKMLPYLQREFAWDAKFNDIFQYVRTKLEKELNRVSLYSNGKIVSAPDLTAKQQKSVDFTPAYIQFFRIFVPEIKSKIELKKGDSGSMLLYNEMIPLASLHAVDDELTSGGSSLVSLPRRSSGKSGAGGENVAKEDQGKEKNTTASRTGPGTDGAAGGPDGASAEAACN